MASELIEAARAGNVDKIRNLVSSGISPDASDVPYHNPLVMAVIKNKEEAVNTLIQLGADVNKTISGLGGGGTALHAAAARTMPNIVKMLLDAGADINKEDNDGRTPLITAISLDNIDMVKFLIANGADINMINRNNETPLYIAATLSNTKVIKLLFSHPSFQNPKIHNSKTVIDLAREGRFWPKINKLILNEAEYRERNIFNNAAGLKPGSEPIGRLRDLPMNMYLMEDVLGPMIGKRRPAKWGGRRKTRATRRHRRRTHKRRA
jgi:ankyrin repeat protein